MSHGAATGKLTAQKRELLALLLEQQGIRSESPIPRRAQFQHPPLSFAQRRLWVLDQLDPNTAAYNNGIGVRAKGRFDERAFELAIAGLIRRHESLRTTFAVVGDEPVQQVAASAEPPITRFDYSHMPHDARESELKQIFRREFARPYELARGPLLRVFLGKMAEDEHVVLIVMHHIISDGWSLGVLLKELTHLYASYASGEQPSLPELPIQYADYSIWQRGWLEGERMQEQLAYWTKQLSGAPPVLDLPADRVRPPLQTVNGTDQRMSLGRELTGSLKQLSRREDMTPFMVLLAGFDLLLSRYSGQTDIVVGTPVASRNRIETENLIGLFLNTLVLRTDLSGAPTVKQLLARARETALGAFANQDVSFERLVEELHPQRDLSRSPLFQILFIVQNAPIRPLELPGLVLEQVSTESPSSKLDLTLDIAEIAGELHCRFEYNTDLFESESISRMMQHFRRTLEWMVQNADTELPVTKVRLFDEEEQHHIMVDLNRTADAYPAVCVHQLLEMQADRSPESIAVSSERRFLTYRELDQYANQLGNYLRKLGVGPETLVGVCSDRSVEMLIALMGLLKAGGAYVPLDPMFPPDRLRFMAEDAELKFILTQQSLRDTLSWSSAELISIDERSDEIAKESTARPESGVKAHNLAYVIYTSGSTGRPKGVMLQHAGVVNLLTSMATVPGLTSKDTLLAVTTLSFDIAGLELYLPLMVGGRVEIASKDIVGDSLRLQQALRECGATATQATPATWRLLIEGGWEGNSKLKVLCGGEALPTDLAKQLLERCGELWNVYGPTETTIWSTLSRVLPRKAVSLGRPLANTQLYVLDEQMQPVPVGVPGELWIGGHGLARGYWKRPELTAERFVTQQLPGLDKPVRIYRTGDQVRYRNDGTLEYLGRLDGQIKLRGYRIELGDIEAALSQADGVAQSVVVLRQDQGDPRIVAYVIPQAGRELSIANLRRELKERLPEYMVPSAFVFLRAFPLTPNGKIDRKSLPAPEIQSTAGPYVAPRNRAEEVVAGIWAEALKRPNVSVDDNFFELGGHSLLLTRVHGEIRKKLNVDVAVVDLFRYPTIRSLAEFLGNRNGEQQKTQSAVERADLRREMLHNRMRLVR